ncbi:hypothetical protein Tco_1419076 [Tanacetum coccineum]
MSPPIRRKYHASVAFATRCRRINKSRRGNRKIRVPIARWPCSVKEKMTLKEVDRQTIQEFETKIIAMDSTITRVPGTFQDYETSEEESVERPRKRDLYEFVDHSQLQQRSHRNEFAPRRLSQLDGNTYWIGGFTPRRGMGFRMELVQGAMPICEGSCHLTPLKGMSCWNDCKSFKVRVGSNGNSLWEAHVLLGRKKGGIRYARKDDRGVVKGREIVRKFPATEAEQRGSYLDVEGNNGNEAILALPEGADDFVVYYDARSKDLEACLEKEKVIACTSRQLKVLMKGCMANVVGVCLIEAISISK